MYPGLPSLIAQRYQPDAELGAGGMGTVYRAFDTQSGATVAVKQLRPDVLRDSPDLLARFIREGETLRRLNHPNIVKLLDAVQSDGQHYLVMEYVAGGDLRDLIATSGRLSIERTVEIAVELTDALARAHHLKIIHRDLKPANVLIAEDGTPRLTDFGVARLVAPDDIRTTGEGLALGTPAYMPPEALAGEPVDAGADLWALGAILFEMLTGAHPFEFDSPLSLISRILTSPPDDLERMRRDVPPALADLVYRLLAKDRSSRIASARRVGALLEDITRPDIPVPVGSSPPVARDADTAIPKTPSSQPALRFASPNNLPAQTTPCLGRDMEIRSAEATLESSRLVTLAGMGGIGKTRLALEIARRQAEQRDPSGLMLYPDGVYFVALAPLSSADAITGAVAEAVNQPFVADDRSPLQQVVDGLRNKTMLLVMDNFEHVIDGADIVRQILEGAPHVRIMATSRERLNLTSEHVLTLSGIDVSDIREEFGSHGAVALFMQAAGRVNPALEWDDATLTAVASICRKVYGVPLALILAAAWCDTLSPAEIDVELSRSFELLESDLRDLPERQRSVRAVFEYSWALITSAQRTTFARLSLFRGGFTREAAQAVAGASLRLLATLQAKSLIRRDNDTGRYDIHPLLTQFAQAALAGMPELRSETEIAFADYFGHVGALESQFGHQEQAAHAVIESEFENLRMALTFAVRHHREADAVRLAMEVSYYCSIVSRFADASAMLNAARATDAAISPTLRAVFDLSEATNTVKFGDDLSTGALAASALAILDGTPYNHYTSVCRYILGAVAVRAGDYVTAKQYAQRGWSDAERDGFGRGAAYCAFSLIWAELYSGDSEQARSNVDRIIKHLEKAGGPSSALGHAYLIKGQIVHYIDAREWFTRSRNIFEQINDKVALVSSLIGLGNAELAGGGFQSAREYLRRSISVSQEIGDRRGEADALNRLGGVEYQLSDFAASFANHQAALTLCRALNNPRGIADSLVLSSIAAEGFGDFDLALTMTNEALDIRHKLGNPLEVVDALINIGLVRVLRGEAALATPYFDEADALLARTPNLYLTHYALLMRSLNELMSGEVLTSLEHIKLVLIFAYDSNIYWLILYGTLGQAAGLAMLHRLAEADETARRLYVIAKSIGNRDIALASMMVRALVRGLAGNSELALARVQYLIQLPESSRLTHIISGAMTDILYADTPPALLERATERAKTMTWDEVGAELLSDVESPPVTS